MAEQSDHDLLIRMDEKLDGLSLKLVDHVVQSERIHANQDTRLTTLEQWKWQWAGAVLILGFLITFAGNVFARFVLPK